MSTYFTESDFTTILHSNDILSDYQSYLIKKIVTLNLESLKFDLSDKPVLGITQVKADKMKKYLLWINDKHIGEIKFLPKTYNINNVQPSCIKIEFNLELINAYETPLLDQYTKKYAQLILIDMSYQFEHTSSTIVYSDHAYEPDAGIVAGKSLYLKSSLIIKLDKENQVINVFDSSNYNDINCLLGNLNNRKILLFLLRKYHKKAFNRVFFNFSLDITPEMDELIDSQINLIDMINL